MESFFGSRNRHLDASAGREVVFCHACRHEWYHDERLDLECPRCNSEATEIVGLLPPCLAPSRSVLTWSRRLNLGMIPAEMVTSLRRLFPVCAANLVAIPTLIPTKQISTALAITFGSRRTAEIRDRVLVVRPRIMTSCAGLPTCL